MMIKAALCEAGALADLGHTDTRIVALPDQLGCRIHEPLLCFSGIAHVVACQITLTYRSVYSVAQFSHRSCPSEVAFALGIYLNGRKELLGLWMAQTEGAKFWLSVMTELKNRGVQDIFVALCGWFEGLPRSHRGCLPYPHQRVVRQLLNPTRWQPEVSFELPAELCGAFITHFGCR